MTTIVIAYVDTRNFDFMVVGETREECNELLNRLWEVHCHEYNYADTDFMQEFIDEECVTYVDAPIGSAFRDGERLI